MQSGSSTIHLLPVGFSSSTSIAVTYSKPTCTVCVDRVQRNHCGWLLVRRHPPVSMYPLILFICF